jgi:hypothetical protein
MPFLMDCPIPEKAWHHERGECNGMPAVARRVQKTMEDAGPWESTIQKILEFQNLRDDWDGLGAVAPSAELLQSAIRLAYLFHEKQIDPPHCVIPGLDGSVNFEWQAPDGTIAEVEIDRPLHAEVMLMEPGKPARFWTLPTE